MKYIITVLTLTLIAFNAYSAKEDCHNLVGRGPKPIQKVNSENLNVRNDYETVVGEDKREGDPTCPSLAVANLFQMPADCVSPFRFFSTL